MRDNVSTPGREDQWLHLAMKAARMVTWEWDVRSDALRYPEGFEQLPDADLFPLHPDLGTLKQAIHPEDAARVEQALTSALAENKTYEVEFRVRLLGGGYCWVRSQGQVLRDEHGQPQRMVGVSMDISRQKQAEEALTRAQEALEERIRQRTTELEAANAALRRSAAHLELALDASHAGTWSWEVASNTARWDNRYHELYGFKPEEPSSHEAWLGRVHPQDRERLQARIQTLQAPGAENDWNEEFRALHPVKGERWMAGLGRTERDAQGRVVGLAGINLDITERKQAEEALRQAHDELESRVQERTAELQAVNRALRESEERLSYALRGATDGLWDWDLTTDQVYYSPRWKEMLGYAEDEVEHTVQAGVGLMDVEDRGRMFSAVADVRAGRTPRLEIEFRLRHKDGHWVDILSRATLIQKAQGQPWRLVGTHVDITRRKRAEEALRESEQKYKTLIETTATGYLILDDRGRVVDANAEYVRLTGHQGLQEILGRSVVEWTAEGDRARNAEEVAKCVRQGFVRNLEVEYVGPGGRTTPIEIQATVVQAGVSFQILSLCRDITDRLRTERALRESEERYRSLVNNLNVGVYRNMPGPEGRFIQANPALARMHGYEDLEEFLKLRVADSYQDPAERPAFLADLKRLGAVRNYEVRLKRKNGALLLGSVTASAHLSPEGEIEWIDGILEDITERKRNEERLAEALELNQTLIAAAPVGIAAYKVTGPCVLCNEAMARTLRAEVGQVLGQNFRRLRSWQKGGLLHLAEKALEEGTLRSGEFHGVTTFGHEVWLECHLAPFLSGGESHLLLMVNDVGERKRAERLLLTQRNLGLGLGLAKDLDQALQCLLEVTTGLEGLDCGGVYLEDLQAGGFRLQAHRGLSPKYVEQVASFPANSAGAALLQAGRPIHELPEPIRSRLAPLLDQEGLHGLLIVPLLHQGRLVGSLNLGSHHDRKVPQSCQTLVEAVAAQTAGVIVRIQAEEARRESEALLQAFFDSPGALRGIVEEMEGDSLFISLNQAAAAALGVTPEQARRRRVSELGLPRGLLQFWAGPAQESRRSGQAVTIEYRDPPQGPLTWWSATLSCLGTAASGKPRFAFMAIDITAKKQAEAALRALPSRILEATEQERQRVARDLHDGVNQLLASVKFRLQGLEKKVPLRSRTLRAGLERSRDLVGLAIEESRRIALNLHPRELDDLGLLPACRRLCEDFRARCKVALEFDAAALAERLPPSMELHLFRILQEALSNIERHAAARQVRVSFQKRGAGLGLEIKDDGAGFDPRSRARKTGSRPGLGLANLRERAAVLGGVCEVSSAPGRGTTLTVLVPTNTEETSGPT